VRRALDADSFAEFMKDSAAKAATRPAFLTKNAARA